MATVEAILDRDGLAELRAVEFKSFPNGAPVLAGDALKSERDNHTDYCAGCIQCWPESIDRESDI